MDPHILNLETGQIHAPATFTSMPCLDPPLHKNEFNGKNAARGSRDEVVFLFPFAKFHSRRHPCT